MIVGIARTALPRHASAQLDGVLNEPRSSSNRMLLSRAGLAGAPAIKLGNLMNVEMPLAELDDLACSFSPGTSARTGQLPISITVATPG